MKIVWDWLKNGRGKSNGSKPASTLTIEVAHLKNTCKLKHDKEDERHMEINKKLDRMDIKLDRLVDKC